MMKKLGLYLGPNKSLDMIYIQAWYAIGWKMHLGIWTSDSFLHVQF